MTVASSAGSHLASIRFATPSDLLTSGCDFRRAIRTSLIPPLRQLVDRWDPRSLIVSAVAPSLVEILARQSRVLFTHITPTQPERATGRGFEERLDFRRGRTESRLGQAGAVGGPGSQLVVPLASAVGYSLTGQLRLDVGNCYELGFRSIDDFCSRFSTPTVSQPPLRTRSFPNLDLVAVATDSVGSLMGAGCRNEGDTMVYYGTYFSACRLRIPLTEFARAKTIDSVPYSWDISLPQYGKFLDNMTTSMRIPHSSSASTACNTRHVSGRGPWCYPLLNACKGSRAPCLPLEAEVRMRTLSML
jgi:hypothetical protein